MDVLAGLSKSDFFSVLLKLEYQEFCSDDLFVCSGMDFHRGNFVF